MEASLISFGMFVGAWMMARHGWPGVAVMIGTYLTLKIVDHLYGAQIGLALAQLTRHMF